MFWKYLILIYRSFNPVYKTEKRVALLYLFNLVTTQGFTINPQMTANLRHKTMLIFYLWCCDMIINEPKETHWPRIMVSVLQ